MPLELTAPPSAEPVTLDQAKAWLKIDTDDDDALIGSLIGAARARAEWHTGQAFVTQSWILWLDRWRPVIEIPLSPLASIQSLTFYAPDAAATVVDSGMYHVDAASRPGRIGFAPTFMPPLLRPLDAVAVAFTAGYGAAADVPPTITTAILVILAALYAARGDENVPMPATALALLAPHCAVKL